jgi:hypothetical protein
MLLDLLTRTAFRLDFDLTSRSGVSERDSLSIRPYFCHTHRIPIAYRSAPFSQECPYMHSASTGLGDTPRRRAISYSPKMAGPAPVINTSRYA